MRRITLTVVTTLAILVLLFSYRTSRDQSITAATVSVASAHVVSGASSVSVVSSAAGPVPTGGTATNQITVPSASASVAATSAAAASTAVPSTAVPKTAVPKTAVPKTAVPKTATPSTTSTASSTTTSSSTATVDGAAVSTRYGDVQVEVVITGGKITDVVPLAYPNEERRDQEINADALPQLRAQVLSAQSANIAGVSGATFTTEGYISSLQSALDAANFK